MAFITWNDSMSVRIAEIDKQHQCLIEHVNRLHDSIIKQERSPISKIQSE
jgi:hemerythrin